MKKKNVNGLAKLKFPPNSTKIQLAGLELRPEIHSKAPNFSDECSVGFNDKKSFDFLDCSKGFLSCVHSGRPAEGAIAKIRVSPVAWRSVVDNSGAKSCLFTSQFGWRTKTGSFFFWLPDSP